MALAIKADNISKAYQLGEFSTGTITSDIHRWWTLKRGKEDPYLKIGETNDRSTKGSSNIVWSLKDINFKIKEGDAVGIIGRNGAGKSTLLKILSKVTSPTTGGIKIKGRIASLLEVGTGFHPELTGRENIFLNGAILGMRKKEIVRKFDEIVNFSGVERYIDTPVKRYSSGMYVRLAFAVAAHLESEILIVDEVLAVGDAEFQKKCLGKMNQVSQGEGRTVLFVSHNMSAIKNLCNSGIMLKHGKVVVAGDINDVVNEYYLGDMSDSDDLDISSLKSKRAFFSSWKLLNGVNDTAMFSRNQCHLNFDFTTNSKIEGVEIGLVLRDNRGELIYSCNSRDNGGTFFDLDEGSYNIDFDFRFPVKHGHYEIDIAVVSKEEIICQWVSKKKLQVLSDFQSPLDEKWLGIISEPLKFSYGSASS
ncbi:ABC transporter ATP-binding protein [Segetibacter sp. 3557_3]|uniref:ABC transporter ATP-binding protein n=1 Tax=Segetibacter sp. 3557_3 TaxID=2547429 RepID=UPI001058DD64|nr:ABC transporter ATP-binding protein [Segetibacter sp. 3557_3]TDH20844.1 ABC transporter ATP-binding protein [Segetibacter sp. 3557_3]